eukprot:scaffold1664_cov233-Chaetoceros_neogracile.AAC.5
MATLRQIQYCCSGVSVQIKLSSLVITSLLTGIRRSVLVSLLSVRSLESCRDYMIDSCSLAAARGSAHSI